MRLRALIADDDADLLDVVSYVIDRFGIDVVSVGSGRELLARLTEDEPFDVIVTDIAMPWMTGLHVIHVARVAGSTCPVIVMTALEVTREQLDAVGNDVYLLRKPFTLAQLELTLVGALDAGIALIDHAIDRGRSTVNTHP